MIPLKDKQVNLENQLEVAEDFDENPKIKCTVGIVINMYENIAKQNHYGAMKKFAELSVEYRAFNNDSVRDNTAITFISMIDEVIKENREQLR